MSTTAAIIISLVVGYIIYISVKFDRRIESLEERVSDLDGYEKLSAVEKIRKRILPPQPYPQNRTLLPTGLFYKILVIVVLAVTIILFLIEFFG